jgi:hypothetical protein
MLIPNNQVVYEPSASNIEESINILSYNTWSKYSRHIVFQFCVVSVVNSLVVCSNLLLELLQQCLRISRLQEEDTGLL